MFKLQAFVEDLRWLELETPAVSEAVMRTQSAWDRNEQLNVDEAIAQHITGTDDTEEDITDDRIRVEEIQAGLANHPPIYGWPPEPFWVRFHSDAQCNSSWSAPSKIISLPLATTGLSPLQTQSNTPHAVRRIWLGMQWMAAVRRSAAHDRGGAGPGFALVQFPSST